MYNRFIKRILDILLSGIGIVVLTPVWLILAVAIKIDDQVRSSFGRKGSGKTRTEKYNISIF